MNKIKNTWFGEKVKMSLQQKKKEENLNNMS